MGTKSQPLLQEIRRMAGIDDAAMDVLKHAPSERRKGLDIGNYIGLEVLSIKKGVNSTALMNEYLRPVIEDECKKYGIDWNKVE